MTFGHGLGVTPEFVVFKARGSSTSWSTYHKSLGNGSRVWLNLTNAASSGDDVWNFTSPTSSVFSIKTGGDFTGDMVAYCWAPVEGYSAFGSYTGNGSTDGPFVYTGFRPKYLLWKVTQNNSNYAGWYTLDASTSPYNEAKNRLHPNASSTEATMSNGIDFLSNGFKLRSSDTDLNGAYTYIYAAFAENPFKYARAR